MLNFQHFFAIDRIYIGLTNKQQGGIAIEIIYGSNLWHMWQVKYCWRGNQSSEHC